MSEEPPITALQPGNERVAWQGKHFTVIETAHRYPDGSVRMHETIAAPDVVRAFAIDEGGRIALIREYRHDVGMRVLRVPAGRVQVGEEPAQAALRELKEEVGITAATCTLLRVSQPILKFRHRAWHFLATGLSHIPATPELGEDVEIVWHRSNEIESLVYSGSIPEDSIAFSLLLLSHRKPDDDQGESTE